MWHGTRQKPTFFPQLPFILWDGCVCESAIDAISCLALHPGSRCLSTAGARPDPHWLRPLLDQGCQVYCGFDADSTGDAMARALITLHPAVQRLRPSHHDWNDVLRSRA